MTPDRVTTEQLERAEAAMRTEPDMNDHGAEALWGYLPAAAAAEQVMPAKSRRLPWWALLLKRWGF